jgi:penicillin-binding protein 1B
VVKIKDGRVVEIISLRDNTARTQYSLEPELVTNLFDKRREKRRLVRFADIPKNLVNAVVAVEDKRFFDHAGFDPLRIAKAAWVDLGSGRRDQGASTLTMQLARGLWLTPEKSFKRKAAETLITLHLEQRLSKQQIFEYYANYVPLGQRGSFSIHGFGEGAQAYFGKDLKKLTLEESALLAALIQLPSYRNPFRWPDRAIARRNVVLQLMLNNGFISERDFAQAKNAELAVARGVTDSREAPYFVDLVNDTLSEKFGQHNFQERPYKIFTTLDMGLQRDAVEAVRAGMVEVDKAIDRLFKGQKMKDGGRPEVQVSLVALDARTGEVRALVGGRNYGLSQLNRALAKRQPGSIFKPFVYATAFGTALYDSPEVITPMSVFDDEPATFQFNGRAYEPGNYKGGYYGRVTARQALTKSLNIPTVRIAEQVGYWRVADVARRAGLSETKGTPAAALGAYEATPIDMAGAYTVFPNQGKYLRPYWIKSIRDESSQRVFDEKGEQKQVLDPRVNFLMVNLLEDVMRSGTGAGARSRGFWQTAGGKTGSSRDGWFAGFTSKLICVVWVGFDDNTDIKLEGARSALPVWTEFMKRAHQRRAYRVVHGFSAPAGVVTVDVEAANGTRTEYFIAGSEPADFSGGTRASGWDADPPKTEDKSEDRAGGGEPRHVGTRKVTGRKVEGGSGADETEGRAGGERRKGFWGRVAAILK